MAKNTCSIGRPSDAAKASKQVEPPAVNMLAMQLFLWSKKQLLTCLLMTLLTVGSYGQSIRKMERRATNRTHITLVTGDTVEIFDITDHRPTTRRTRTYHWYSHNGIHDATGSFQQKLLHGPYQRLDREQHLLAAGEFSNGLKAGRWRTWWPDGSLSSSSKWAHGHQKGKTKLFERNGTMQQPQDTVAHPAARRKKKRLLRRSGKGKQVLISDPEQVQLPEVKAGPEPTELPVRKQRRKLKRKTEEGTSTT